MMSGCARRRCRVRLAPRRGIKARSLLARPPARQLARTCAAGEGVGHTSTVWEVSFDARGQRMVSCSDDRTLKIWDCRQERGARLLCSSCLASSGCTPHALRPHPRSLPSRGVAGQPQWQLLATLAGHHDRTIFSVDWSAQGHIVTGSADNAIRVFAESSSSSPGSTGAGSSSGSSIRALFSRHPGEQQEQQQQQQQQDGQGSGEGGGARFLLTCQQQQAHEQDVNCVRWHPTDPTVLASAGDDCTVRLWRYTPPCKLSD